LEQCRFASVFLYSCMKRLAAVENIEPRLGEACISFLTSTR